MDARSPEFNYVGCDKFVRVPRIRDDGYVDALVGICLEEKVDVLIPNHTEELDLLDAARREFEAVGTRLLITGGKRRIANDKIRWMKFFADTPVHVPLSFHVRNVDEVELAVNATPGTPFCIKRRGGCGGRGLYLVNHSHYQAGEKSGVPFASPEMLREAFEGGEELLLQEYLTGDEYTVDLLMDHGEPLCGVTKLNSVMRGGIAMVSEVVRNEAVTSMCIEAAKLLQMDGNVGFDLIVTGDGQPHLIDINPRRTATISLARKAGLNILWYSVKRALGEPLPTVFPEAAPGTKVIRKTVDFFFDGEGATL